MRYILQDAIRMGLDTDKFDSISYEVLYDDIYDSFIYDVSFNSDDLLRYVIYKKDVSDILDKLQQVYDDEEEFSYELMYEIEDAITKHFEKNHYFDVKHGD